MPADLPQTGAELSERDSELIQRIEAEGLTAFTFDGIRRLTGSHPETLSRSIERLEDSGIISKTAEGYVVEDSARAFAARAAAPNEQRVPLLQTLLPYEVDPEAVAASLRGKWFGSLRWVGVSQTADGLTLKWVNEDGSLSIDAWFSRGELSVEARIREGASLSSAVKAAHQLMNRVSRLYSGPGRRGVSYMRLNLPGQAPAGM